jgi:stage II sporulation protein D
VPGYAVRAVFETPEGRPLGGSAVRFETRQQDGALAELVARGRGWGHGVGLCQWGAVGRARAGQDVRTILNAYFPGTTVARAY